MLEGGHGDREGPMALPGRAIRVPVVVGSLPP
jgi:hypothetical protein